MCDSLFTRTTQLLSHSSEMCALSLTFRLTQARNARRFGSGFNVILVLRILSMWVRIGHGATRILPCSHRSIRYCCPESASCAKTHSKRSVKHSEAGATAFYPKRHLDIEVVRDLIEKHHQQALVA